MNELKRPAPARVNPRVSPRPNPIADDGDEFRFCSTCAFSAVCLAQGYDKSALRELHCLVEHVGPFHDGEHVFREGEPFNAIAAVRAGTVKTYVTDPARRDEIVEPARRRFGHMGRGLVVGDTDELVAHYRAHAERGVERFYCWFTDFADPATLDAVGTEVIPNV